jgi:hypothetical protein
MMIDQAQLASLTPAQRAAVIYRQAQSELSQSLWRAALGDGGDRDDGPAPWAVPGAQKGGLQSILALIGGAEGSSLVQLLSGLSESRTALEPAAEARSGVQPAAPTAPPVVGPMPMPMPLQTGELPATELCREALGSNARFAPAIERAADRTGIPATALAAILDAEAGRGRDGSWNTHSRNPRSSAAGLGQFLSGTWEGEAERPGTWLNGEAQRRGWLNAKGDVSLGARGQLLALRYDPEASIQATADYARRNLERLRESGVSVGEGSQSVARAAYLGHHLGPGDAARFLNGGLDSARARRLLNAQVGQASAAQRIVEAGDAAQAHRVWLNGYIEKRIRPARYA